MDVHRFVQLVAVGLDEVRRGTRRRGRRCDRRSVCGAADHSPIRLRRVRPTAHSTVERFHHDGVEGLTAAELDAAHVTEALPRAEALVGEEPLRERGVELLMSALYRSGRHRSGARAYQRHRNLLADDVGVVPSPCLQRLNERILLHDPTLLVSPPQVSTIRQPARNPYKGLRPFGEDDAGDFFGRDALVGTMLDSCTADAGCWPSSDHRVVASRARSPPA